MGILGLVSECCSRMVASMNPKFFCARVSYALFHGCCAISFEKKPILGDRRPPDLRARPFPQVEILS